MSCYLLLSLLLLTRALSHAFMTPRSRYPLPAIHHQRPVRLPQQRVVGRIYHQSPSLLTRLYGNDVDSSTEASDFAQYKNHKALRDVVQKCPTFARLSAFDVGGLVETCSVQEVASAGDYVIRKGDVPDAFYMVRSGAFEAVVADEDGGEAVATTYGPGDSFGELGLLYGGPRAASIRATKRNSSVWKVDQETFTQLIFQNEDTKQAAQAVANENYPDFVQRLPLKAAVRQCPIFKGIENTDLERVVKSMHKISVPPGANLITQGERGDGMYFVASGKFDCIDEKTGKTVNVVERNGYFGELALLFNEARAVSVRASESLDCEVWFLPKKAFDEAIQESQLSANALKLLKDKYQETAMWKLLLKLSSKDLWDLGRSMSRPKKKKVSFHSFLSTLLTGALFATGACFWAPRWKDSTGLPQLFDIAGKSSPSTALLMRFTNVLSIVVSASGFLRFPPNTTSFRFMGFATMCLAMLASALASVSNVLGVPGGNYLLDGWSWGGRLLVFGTSLLAVAVAAIFTENVVVEPYNEDRRLVPMFETSARSTISLLLFWPSFLGLVSPALAMLESRESFNNLLLPLYQATGFGNYMHFTLSVAVAYFSFGALYATLQFEKRIRPRTSTIFLGTTLLLLGYEPVKFLWNSCRPANPLYSQFSALYSHLGSILVKYHVRAILGGITALAILNGIRRLMIARKDA